MQRIIRDQILEHVEHNSMFSDNQHGFRSGKSCVTQLIEVMEEWAVQIDNGVNMDIIYFDFSNAFDKVCHRLLLHKLYSYGIQGELHAWVKE